MSDFNALAHVYKTIQVGSRQAFVRIPEPQIIRSGPFAECVKWFMAMDETDRQFYLIAVPLEAGFVKSELSYQDIEAIFRRSDFPK
jgi:hypothetical protein